MIDTSSLYMNVRRKGLIVMIIATVITIAVPLSIARHLLETGRLNDAGVRPNYLSHKLVAPVTASSEGVLDELLAIDLRSTPTVPRIYLARLPEGLDQLTNAQERKRVFISSLLPLILRANEIILAEREALTEIKAKMVAGQRVRNSEIMFMRRIERRVRIETKGIRTPTHINKLLHRLDIVPPSLAITQAAIESGWGTSRFAREGNALFGEWLWGEGQGILPSRREEGKTHRIKSFDYLIDSVLSYIDNLNRNSAYSELRERRANMRSSGKVIRGNVLAETLIAYSERGQDYIEDVKTIMRQNGFDSFDHIALSAPKRRSFAAL